MRRRGFTLIELLVVMAIVALLATVALPRYFHSLDLAKERALQENLRVMRTTIDKFYADKGRYPSSLEELVDQHYLRAIPRDPITDSTNTWVPAGPSVGGDEGLADVFSGAAGTGSDGTEYGTW